MENVKRKSSGTQLSLCVQPAFIIGTVNEDGSHNFAPITWVSVTSEKDGYLMIVSMYGTKMTKQNVIRTGRLSVNLVSSDMLKLMDYFGTHHAKDGKKDAIPYSVTKGEVVDVPCLAQSRWVYECEVVDSIETGLSTTFICQIKNIQIDERLTDLNESGIDLVKLDPVIYTGMYNGIGNYFSIGANLGRIGDLKKHI